MEKERVNDFEISSIEIYAMLKKKNVKYLYHANTLTTATTFIEQGALLSRQYIESNKLNQTTQKSDNKDKYFDIWDNVFLDAIDLHSAYQRANFYGPVLFRLKLDILLSLNLPKLYITKNNPIYWNNSSSLDSKYYSEVQDIEADFLTGKRNNSSIMFTFKSVSNKIEFQKYLDSIILDKANFKVRTSKGLITFAGDYCEQRIRNSLKLNKLEKINIYQRHKNVKFCSCGLDYWKLYHFNIEEFKKRFNYQHSNL